MLVYLFAGILGSILASFILATSPSSWSALWRRSQCSWCYRTLKWRDLVPIFSYLNLRGRCRYCGGSIPVLLFLGELLGFFLTIGLGLLFKDPLLGVCLSVIVVTLVAISRDDLKSHEISLHHLAVLLVLRLLLMGQFPLGDGVQGGLIVGSILGLLYLVTKGIGDGDIYLGAILGSFFSPWDSILHFLCPSWIFGGLVGAYLLLIKKQSKHDEIAFAPFLCIGFLIGLCNALGGLGWNG